MVKYNYAQFDLNPDGAEHNDQIFENPNGVLGIEVKIKVLAAKCSLGNINYHGSKSTVETPSAVEQALTWQLPPDGATLAIVRCGAESVAAMAVLASRQEGLEIDEEVVAAIGRFYRLGSATSQLDDRVIAISHVAADFKRPLAKRVAWIQTILSREENPDEIAEMIEAHDQEAEEARAASEIRVEDNGGFAFRASTYPHATQLGYGGQYFSNSEDFYLLLEGVTPLGWRKVSDRYYMVDAHPNVPTEEFPILGKLHVEDGIRILRPLEPKMEEVAPDTEINVRTWASDSESGKYYTLLVSGARKKDLLIARHCDYETVLKLSERWGFSVTQTDYRPYWS